MSTELNEHELRAAAEEFCRTRGIAERDEVDNTLPKGWHADTASYQFQVLVGGRPVDAEGNVVPTVLSGRHRDPAVFYGSKGLVEAWALMQVIRDRAATLGVEVKVTLESRATIKVERSWRSWSEQ